MLNRFTVLTVFTGCDDLPLILKRNPGVWDENVQQDGMCLSTVGTLKTLNAEYNLAALEPNGSLVATVFPHIATMPASACDLMQLQPFDDGIIIFLRKGIEIFRLNCYHISCVSMEIPVFASI